MKQPRKIAFLGRYHPKKRRDLELKSKQPNYKKLIRTEQKKLEKAGVYKNLFEKKTEPDYGVIKKGLDNMEPYLYPSKTNLVLIYLILIIAAIMTWLAEITIFAKIAYWGVLVIAAMLNYGYYGAMKGWADCGNTAVDLQKTMVEKILKK